MLERVLEVSDLGRAAGVGASVPVKNDARLVQACRKEFPRAQKGKLHLTSRWERQVNQLAKEARDIVLPLRRRRAGNKSVSDTTKKARVDTVMRFLRVLSSEGVQINTMRDIGERHVARYLKWMVAAGHCRSYCNNVYVHLKHFMEKGLGKYNCIKPVEHYLGAGVLSQLNAASSKAITGKVDEVGVPLDAEELTERVTKEDHLSGLVLKLCLFAGLRRNEALSVQPHLCLQADGKLYVRETGAKNARARLVDLALVPDFQAKAIAVIEQMKTHCRNNDDTVLQGRRLIGAQKRFRRACEKVGITRKDVGVTPHSFRHEWFHRAWAAAGHVVPLLGTLPPSSTTERALSVQVVDQRILIESVGHSDPSKCGSYYGSHAKQRKASGVSRKDWSRALGRVMDIPRGDVEALKRRREEVLNMPLSQLDDIIMANFLEGRQWEQPICREMRFTPPPSK